MSLDLDAYLDRIAYTGPRTPTLDALREIVLHHVEAIPFENLDPFLKRPVLLDIEALQEKLVRSGRGGYCFEQNLLLKAALEAIGLSVRGLAARVRWGIPEDRPTAKTHMLLLVRVEGAPFIADVGFGGPTLTGILRLEEDIEQRTPHEPFRLIESGEAFGMEAKLRDEWELLYEFDLQEQLLPDYELANWYLRTHPSSRFVTGLTVARAEPGRRYALRNHELAVHELGGKTTRHAFQTPAEVMEALKTTFGITLPDPPALEIALEELMARSVTNQSEAPRSSSREAE